MKTVILAVLISFTFTSCKHQTERQPSAKPINGKISKKCSPKRIGDYMSGDFPWVARQSDTASYYIRIIFEKESMVYQFHGQCFYWFFTNHYHTGADKIELLWSYKNDCLLDMGFLERSNGFKRYPKYGDAFCEYSLKNDSVIKVKYNFPEWVRKVNETQKDSIFPTYFYLEKHDSI